MAQMPVESADWPAPRRQDGLPARPEMPNRRRRRLGEAMDHSHARYHRSGHRPISANLRPQPDDSLRSGGDRPLCLSPVGWSSRPWMPHPEVYVYGTRGNDGPICGATRGGAFASDPPRQARRPAATGPGATPWATETAHVYGQIVTSPAGLVCWANEPPLCQGTVDFLQVAPLDTRPIPRYAAKRRPQLGMIGKEGGSVQRPPMRAPPSARQHTGLPIRAAFR